VTDPPSIEQCWLVYRDSQIRVGLDPLTEDEFKQAFYCGFESALLSVEVMAEILEHQGSDASEVAWSTLFAEFEKFAESIDKGDIATNH